jgi:hypothetical protein
MQGGRIMAVALLLAGCGRGPLWFFEDRDRPDRIDCDRADLLFVVDDSPSMQIHQRDLVENFPAFLDGVDRIAAQGTDLHVGVTTTDAYYGNPEACQVFGALVTQTVGINSSDATCGPYAEGANYMTSADPLAEAFACAAKVGTLGDEREQPLAAVLAALDPTSPAAPCNAGFLRDDAILVVVLLTDERDQSPNSPERLALDLRTLKGGNDDAIAVVSLIDDGTPCSSGAETCYDTRLFKFTRSFSHGFLGSIDGDYAEHFDRAVDVVADVCAAE